ncbi:large conductance mechanosensitive channel protein MscL [Flavobacteriaceae bacterium Ap0902]|nr:large conductance mechanosensitive channel protein MscL [Flavobacteriaceae bacterium Ap0902]
MKFWTEFKEFALKGNMVDMAVGVIIGTAFNKLLTAFVDKILMPPLNLLTNGVHIENKEILLKDVVLDANGEVVSEKLAIQYGDFINTLVDFFIIAIVIFMVVKVMNKLRRSSEDTEDKTVETPKDIQLLDNLNKLIEEQNQILKNK